MQLLEYLSSARRGTGWLLKSWNEDIVSHVAGCIYYAANYGIIGRLLVKLFRSIEITNGRTSVSTTLSNVIPIILSLWIRDVGRISDVYESILKFKENFDDELEEKSYKY